MRRIRFDTVQDVFDGFPDLADLVGAVPGEEAPVACLERLVRTGRIDDAVTLCGFVLPRREAVWWACRCVAAGSRGLSADDRRRWELVAAWVHRPEERRRLAVFEAGAGLDPKLAIVSLINAAVWSGGAMDPTSPHPIPAAPDFTAKAARSAVLLTAAAEPSPVRRAFLERCVSTALAIAREDGDLADEVVRVVRA